MTMLPHDRPPLEQPAASGRSSSRRAWALAALAIVGQACGLQLIDVQPFAAYQHFETWHRLLPTRPIAASGVLVQALIVAVAAWRLRAQLRDAVRGVISWPAALVVAALASFSLAVPTVSVSRFAGEMILAGALQLVSCVNLMLVALTVPEGTLRRTVGWIDERVTVRPGDAPIRRWDKQLPVWAAVWVAVAAGTVSYAVFERVPHIDDSVSYYFHAKYLATGRWYLPPPPDSASFSMDLTVIDPAKWYGYGVPGWPLVLALGVRLGAPWLVNPILGALLIFAAHALVRRRYDRGTANVLVLLLALSPWLIFMSAEFMTHPLTGLLVLLGALWLERAAGRERRWALWASLAGVALGGLMLTRTFDGGLAVAALVLTILIDRRFSRAFPALVIAGTLAGALSVLDLPYNRALTGRATYPPHLAWADRRWGPGVDRLGFGADVGIPAWRNLDPLPGHGPADVILNANKNVFMTSVELFGWACGSLLFVWLGFALRRWRSADALMLSLCAVFVLGYSAYWFSGGPDLGARYWYVLLVPLTALTVRGAQAVAAQMNRHGMPSNAGARLGALVLVASASAAVTMMPWRAATKYYRYRGIGGQIRELAASQRIEHGLVFVRSERRTDYQSAFNLNPSTFADSATIYALDAGPAHRAAVVARFADRPVWVIGRGDADPRGPWVVLAGPLPAGSVPN